MADFEEILKIATEKVAEKYFLTKIRQANDSSKYVYRERIYCYELYHQIRTEWGSNPDINFFGEYDKSGSSLYTGTSSQGVKPDFSIHSPGDIDSNFIAMEVKSSNASESAIKKDIEKLIKLTTYQNFKYGIYLIYGKNAIKKGEIAKKFIDEKSKSNIKIFMHSKAETKAFALDSESAI